jgi:DNA ligase-1
VCPDALSVAPGTMPGMKLEQLVTTSAAVAGTRSRSAKAALLAATLAAADADEIALVTRYLTGSLRQRRPGVGWAAFKDAPPPSAEPVLEVADVDVTFDATGAETGSGSAGRRTALLHDLLGRATASEQRFIGALVSGELRQGALESVVVDALAKAFDAPVAAVRRAVMLGGEVPAVAATLARTGIDGLGEFTLTVGRAVQPMLAAAAPDVAQALTKVGATAEEPARLDWKLDGVRVQVHRDGDDVLVASRSLDDLTSRLPEVVAVVRSLPVRRIVLDGEVIVLDEAGRPAPFQVTASRTATRLANDDGAEAGAAGGPLSVFFFDILHVDDRDLIDSPASERWDELARVVPAANAIPSLTTADPVAAQRFFDAALEAGQEGLVVKSPTAPYAAGRRGAGWVKVKPRHTLDLVVLAAEWGHGRRTGVLSNLHLGARGSDGEYVMVGKTFKGLTDELLSWQTAQFLIHERSRDASTVTLDPVMVVEIAIDGVQTSRRYAGGAALRFARVLRYRPDKTNRDIDTIEEILRIRDSSSASDDG